MQRKLVFREGASNKFWQIATTGKAFNVTFGKVGTAGTTQTKSFSTPQKCEEEAEKIVQSKLKKGYRDDSATGGKAQAEKASAPSSMATKTDPWKKTLAPFFGKNCKVGPYVGRGTGEKRTLEAMVFDADADGESAGILLSSLTVKESFGRVRKSLDELVVFAVMAEGGSRKKGVKGLIASPSAQLEGLLFYDRASGEVFKCDEGSGTMLGRDAIVLNKLKFTAT